jgi:hypothetical protein
VSWSGRSGCGGLHRFTHPRYAAWCASSHPRRAAAHPNCAHRSWQRAITLLHLTSGPPGRYHRCPLRKEEETESAPQAEHCVGASVRSGRFPNQPHASRRSANRLLACVALRRLGQT